MSNSAPADGTLLMLVVLTFYLASCLVVAYLLWRHFGRAVVPSIHPLDPRLVVLPWLLAWRYAREMYRDLVYVGGVTYIILRARYHLFRHDYRVELKRSLALYPDDSVGLARFIMLGGRPVWPRHVGLWRRDCAEMLVGPGLNVTYVHSLGHIKVPQIEKPLVIEEWGCAETVEIAKARMAASPDWPKRDEQVVVRRFRARKMWHVLLMNGRTCCNPLMLPPGGA